MDGVVLPAVVFGAAGRQMEQVGGVWQRSKDDVERRAPGTQESRESHKEKECGPLSQTSVQSSLLERIASGEVLSREAWFTA